MSEKTPLDLALANKHNEIVDMITGKGVRCMSVSDILVREGDSPLVGAKKIGPVQCKKEVLLGTLFENWVENQQIPFLLKRS